MANSFKKPRDESEFGKLTREEQDEYLEELSEKLEKGDERALILAALKTFMPPVIIFCLVFFIIAMLLFG